VNHVVTGAIATKKRMMVRCRSNIMPYFDFECRGLDYRSAAAVAAAAAEQ